MKTTSPAGRPRPERPWPLLGRDAELDEAARALCDPHSSGVLVAGACGTGRSRLAYECAQLARRRGHPELRVTATPAARSVPFGALAHLLRPGSDGAPPTLSGTGPASGRRPVLLLDDAHHLDGASAGLLASWLRTGRVALVATTDATHPPVWPDPALHRVHLRPLPQAVVSDLVERVLGGAVERRAVRMLHRASGGRPRDLRELVDDAVRHRTLVAGGRPVAPGGPALGDPAAAGTDRDPAAAPRPATPRPPRTVGGVRAPPPGPAAPGLRGPPGGRRLGTPRRGGAVHLRRTRRAAVRGRAARGPSGAADPPDPAGPDRPVAGSGHRPRRAAAVGALAHSTRPTASDPDELERALVLARRTHDHALALRLARELARIRPRPRSLLLLAEELYEHGHPREAERYGAAGAATSPPEDDERLAAVVLHAQSLAFGLLRMDEAFAVNAAARRAFAGHPDEAVLGANETALWSLVGDVRRAERTWRTVAPEPGSRADVIAAVPRVYCLTESGRTGDAVRAARLSRAGRRPCTAVDAVAHPALLVGAEARALAESGSLAAAEELARQGYDLAMDAARRQRPDLAGGAPGLDLLPARPAARVPHLVRQHARARP